MAYESCLVYCLQTSFKVGKLPFLYLGLPIGAPSRSKVVWDLVAPSFIRKLS